MATDIDAALDALGDPTRRRITGRLAAGLVSGRAAGNRRVCHLEPGALRRLRDHLEWYWERSLTACQRAAEARAREQSMTSGQEIVATKTVRVNAPLAVAFEVFIGHSGGPWTPITSPSRARRRGRRPVIPAGRSGTGSFP